MNPFVGDEPTFLPEIVHMGKHFVHWNPDVILTYNSGSTSSPYRSFVLCKISHVHLLRFQLNAIRFFCPKWKHCQQNSSEGAIYNINNPIKRRLLLHCHPLSRRRYVWRNNHLNNTLILLTKICPTSLRVNVN